MAGECEQLKIKLAQQYTDDREQYTQAKTKFINAILHKVRADTTKYFPAIVFLTGASGAGKTTILNEYKVVLVHCENNIRHKRLQQHRQQPELINDTMDTWAAFLKKQAIYRQAIILDTTFLNPNQMASQFESLIDIEKLL